MHIVRYEEVIVQAFAFLLLKSIITIVLNWHIIEKAGNFLLDEYSRSADK
jgi:hypothetical protein